MSARRDGNNIQFRQPGGYLCGSVCIEGPFVDRDVFLNGEIIVNHLELFQTTIGTAENLVIILFPP